MIFEDDEGRVDVEDADGIHDGRYDVWEKVGMGGFATVVTAFDNQRQEDVALKIIRNIPRYRRYAYVECKILDDLMEHGAHKHSCIVRFYGNFSARIRNQDHVCMSFECLGRSLLSFMNANNRRGFHTEATRGIIFQIMHAVTFCHSIGLTHADLKPENILFYNDTYTGDKQKGRILKHYHIRVIDFGNACYDKDTHTSNVQNIGYRAPEVVLGIGWDQQIDIWSIGCMIVEVFTGHKLFITREPLEHLALMEKILQEKVPKSMIVKVEIDPIFRPAKRQKLIQTRVNDRDMESVLDIEKKEIKWPSNASSEESIHIVQTQKPLPKLLMKAMSEDEIRMLDLCRQCLVFDPLQRILAKDALRHSFLSSPELRSTYLPVGVDIFDEP